MKQNTWLIFCALAALNFAVDRNAFAQSAVCDRECLPGTMPEFLHALVENVSS